MNPIAIIIAAVAGMVIGALWYGPIFGKTWMKLQGITAKDVAKFKKDPKKMRAMKRSYVLSLLNQVIIASVLAFFISEVGATEINEGVAVAAIAWLGFVVTTAMNQVLWENKTRKAYLLDIAHYLVVFLAMGAILAW